MVSHRNTVRELEEEDGDIPIQSSRHEVYPEEREADISILSSSKEAFEEARLKAAMCSLTMVEDDENVGRIFRAAVQRGNRDTVSAIFPGKFLVY